MECKLISEHFIRSDYWHIYPTFFFYFSSVLNELNSYFNTPIAIIDNKGSVIADNNVVITNISDA